MTGALIVAARRTPIGTAGRSLAGVTAAELGGAVVRAVADDLGEVPAEVVLGNCMGPGGNVARVASLTAGLPVEVPALTVDRQCASGLAAIELGARLVSGGSGPVVAGGVESASTAPWRFWPPEAGGPPVRYERAPFAPASDDVDMGVAADLLAQERGVTRERQDAYAAESHARAVLAAARGEFDAEIVAVGGVAADERPRAGLTAERLARFRAAFREGGTVTIGNSCGVNDGAAAVGIVPAGSREGAAGRPGLRVLGAASAGVAPGRPGIGLVPAVKLALAEAGLAVGDLDVIEFNEAFAGQVLACYDALGIDPGRACAGGGALALGHPWGASGAVLVVRLFTQLVRQGRGRYGLAAIAAGGGQGTALVVEACR
ncbi:thiolase family protein [Intrasporangium sp.]|uniref:thiolase family protein n=1 Tax=Intrasporangium sp. TaxID=1925024 RepID=UPI00293B0C6D|nr:thiolase family protein [Intrasporangium sp.]MDV3222083.1 thiolase family protein [Intrasporangium sp.]